MSVYAVFAVTGVLLSIFIFMIFPEWEKTEYLDSDDKYAAILKNHWKWIVPLMSVLLAIFFVAIFSLKS